MKTIKKHGITALLLTMIGIYLLAIAYINLSHTPSFYDADMYADVLYAVKAWEGKSIFPANWIYGNQLNVVAAPVLAALFCGICADPFQAMGIASTVMSVLLLLTMNWMLKPVLRERTPRLVSILAFMSVMLYYNEAVHGLKGWQLFFTMCAYYAGYCMTLFLAIGCYLRAVCRLDRKHKSYIFCVVLTCILSFGTGIQSIRQTLVMVIPVAGIELLRLLEAKCHRRKVDKAPLIVAAVISASNIAGVLMKSQLKILESSNLGTIDLAPVSEWPAALLDAAITIYAMFVNYDTLGFIIFGGLMLAYAGGICLCVRQAVTERSWNIAVPMLILAAGVCAIGAVDVLTTMDVAERYYFPMYPLIGVLVAYLYAAGSKVIKAYILAVLVVIFGLSCKQELVPVFQEIGSNKTDYAYEISDYLVENDYTHACSLWYTGVNVAVASGGEIEGVFRQSEDRPFSTSGFLHDPNVYAVDPGHCAYLFKGADDAANGIAAAREKGVEMELLVYFEESDHYLFTAPVNLLDVFS